MALCVVCIGAARAAGLGVAHGSEQMRECASSKAALVSVDAEPRGKGKLTVYGLEAFFGAALNSTGVAAALVAAPADAGGSAPGQQCTALHDVSYAGNVVLVARGGCSFVHKAALAQAAGARAVLVADLAEGAGPPSCGCGNETAAAQGVRVPVTSVGAQDGHALLSELDAGSLGVRLALVHVPLIDASAFVLAALATAVVAAGAAFANLDTDRRKAAHAMRAHPSEAYATEQSVEIGTSSVVAFVVMASLMLVVLFFLMSDTFMLVIIAFFCLGSAVCLQNLLVLSTAALRASCGMGVGPRERACTLPICGRVTLTEAVASVVSVATAVTWFVFRNTQPWAWVLQDIMGSALMVNMLKSLRLPNLKVGAFLLLAVLFYDVFWVFLSPLLFRGKSVMVAVATGEGSRDTLPMLLKCPHVDSPGGGYAMLGFGDVVLPGMLASFALRFDRVRGKSVARGCFAYVLGAYVLGLAATFTALVLMDGRGQPALLYLSPSVLGTVVVLGFFRGELRALAAPDATEQPSATLLADAAADGALADGADSDASEGAIDEEAPLIAPPPSQG